VRSSALRLVERENGAVLTAGERPVPATPLEGGLGIARAGWLAALAVHGAAAALALFGLPLREAEPWPAGDFAVSLVFERAPDPAPSPASPALEDVAPLPEPSPPVEIAAPPPEPAPVPIVLPLPEPPPPVEIAALPPEPPPVPIVLPLPEPPPPVEIAALPPEPAPRPTAPPAAAAPPVPRTKPPVLAAAGSAAAPAEPARPASAALPPDGERLAALPLVPPRPVSARAGNRKPDYPAEARRRRLQGQVVLRVDVSAHGTAEHVRVLTSSGHPILDDAAAAAVRAWRFEPARRGGMPVPEPVDVPVRFRIED
jgi:protein TonB